MADNLAHPCNLVVAIDVLPNDVLLEIFDFCVPERHLEDFIILGNYDDCVAKRTVESWQSLVHVCRRWRGLVFESPRRLNLRLCCTPGKPARISLDIWPAFPLLILVGNGRRTSVDDIAPQLKHSNRISQIGLICSTIEQIENVWGSMQVPFPELEDLSLSNVTVGIDMVPVLPDSFLGGSAPRLRFLSFSTISFPGLPNLLLSATRLVNLFLFHIPHSGYISPEAMVTCLSMLTSLEELALEFESPESSPDQEIRRSPPSTRSILPALNIFDFKGVNEYLEDLVSWIDTPRLYQLLTAFFDDIDFDTPELNQFLIRTPSLRAYDEAHLDFLHNTAIVSLHQSQPERSRHATVEVKILSEMSDWRLSSLTQICALALRSFLTMENLYIYERQYLPPDWKDDIESTEWLDLLRPFTAVKNLYLSNNRLPHIAPALQELTGGRTTEVLPTLKNVFLQGFQSSGPVQEGIAQFISARQLTGHPVEISVWDTDPLMGIGNL